MIIKNQFGLDMYVEVSGNVNSDTTVMFLNGVMASVSSWNDIKKPFEKLGFRVVCHDFVGQLKSNPLTSVYSFEMHAKDVIHIMDTLQISSAYLIGTSYGGEISIKLASLYPDRVAGMAVINSVSETDALMIATVNHWKKLCDIEDKEVFFWGMATSIYGVSYMEKFYDTMAIRAKAMNQLPASYFSSLKFLIDTFVKDANMTKELVNVKCPTLVICGEDDRLKPVKYSQIIAKSIVNSEFLLIVDCGHVTIFEQTETLVSAMVGFFLKLRRKFMQRLISALFEYQEYIILVFIPVLFGFAYFWLIFFAKHFIKVLKYSYGFILPFVINLYYLYGLIQASLQSDFSATVSALAYFALSLSATFTYAILSISAHSFIKKK